MAKAKEQTVRSKSSTTSTGRVARDITVGIVTGDISLINGIRAGLDERVTAHAAKRRDARIEDLITEYLAS